MSKAEIVVTIWNGVIDDVSAENFKGQVLIKDYDKLADSDYCDQEDDSGRYALHEFEF